MEHYKNEVLGPRYAVRLRDLQSWHVLKAVCPECRRATMLTPETLRGRWPAYTRLVDLEPKLRCRKCGNRDGNRFQVMKLPRN